MNAPLRQTPVCKALLAVPGSLETPTGGYGYARRLLEEADGVGLVLRKLPLPNGFPFVSDATIAETGAILASAPAGWPILVDGLALGVLPPNVIRGASGPVIALCHHPLGLESGLEPGVSERLIAAERAALAASVGVVTTSQTTARLLVAEFAVPERQVAVARPGTDRVQEELPCPASPTDGPVQILSVGSLTPRKGHDVLLSALAMVLKLDWHMTIAGPQRDAAHTVQLETLAAALGLDDRVQFTGAVDAATLSRLYRQADIFALASRFEGYGMAYTEAMAHGLPVLGCDVGAVAEATVGGATLVPPDDVGAFADALRPLIASLEAREAAAAAARRAARDLPTWTDTAFAVRAAITAFAPHDR